MGEHQEKRQVHMEDICTGVEFSWSLDQSSLLGLIFAYGAVTLCHYVIVRGSYAPLRPPLGLLV